MERHTDEHALTARVAQALSEALAQGLDLGAEFQVPDPDRYVMYPFFVDPMGRFSIASAVWNVGQGTPVHGHETWGVVGIYAGREFERAYEKPAAEGEPLAVRDEHIWSPGEVTVCCTTDDDVHEVRCEGDSPVVGIHVYGADIGRLRRRSYQPQTGAVSWFVSSWATPAANT
ncbi:hypothetical protein [Nonomuraea insulae]|uniref:3-mercaptopropionate dioxygenase n=1 Tax=Nonomuraea insulae TaxID=1616787 RepID=A0ABW1DA42_9ACTN